MVIALKGLKPIVFYYTGYNESLKTIILFRHGKAEKGTSILDHDIPLSSLGIKEAKKAILREMQNG